MRATAPALLLALVLSAFAAAADTVILGTDGAFPPNVFLEEGRPLGFEPDLAADLCARAGHDCRWKIVPFDDLLPALADGRIDAIMAGMAATPERLRTAAFGQAYISADLSRLVALPGAAVPGFAGTRVAVQPATWQAAHAEAAGAILVRADTLDAARAKLVAGGADAIFGPTDWLAPLGETVVDVADPVPSPAAAAMAFRPADAALRDSFDAALEAARADGALAGIRGRWFGQD